MDNKYVIAVAHALNALSGYVLDKDLTKLISGLVVSAHVGGFSGQVNQITEALKNARPPAPVESDPSENVGVTESAE